ncbi:MAG: hypothetical protein GEV06_27355 [Luteitalea sp.]|nr:hypothetical protein [Luteitalea sp.]
MPDWDADSPRLQQNLRSVLRRIRDSARARELPTVEAARSWHAEMLTGLDLPGMRYAGAFRGEAGLEHAEVRVGRHLGVRAADVGATLTAFERVLHSAVTRLDELVPRDAALDADRIAAVLELCAWAHAEWIRIHPFVNGNGRTARLWANGLAMRYGLPPFVRLRPRPDDDDYGAAGEQAMLGNWGLTAAVFRRMLLRFLDEASQDT